MKRTELLILLITVLFLSSIGVLLYVANKKKSAHKGAVISSQKEIQFKQDITEVDTLYRSYRSLLFNTNKALLSKTRSQLQNKLNEFQSKYCSTTELPSQISQHILTNYMQLILLSKKRLQNLQQGATNKKQLEADITEWDKANQDMKAENILLKHKALDTVTN
jgi:hypothetical protein